MINDYIYLFNIITQIKLRTSVLGRLRDLQYIFVVIYETLGILQCRDDLPNN